MIFYRQFTDAKPDEQGRRTGFLHWRTSAKVSGWQGQCFAKISPEEQERLIASQGGVVLPYSELTEAERAELASAPEVERLADLERRRQVAAYSKEVIP